MAICYKLKDAFAIRAKKGVCMVFYLGIQITPNNNVSEKTMVSEKDGFDDITIAGILDMGELMCF